MNPVLDSIYKHRSIRSYKNKPIEEEKLQHIIKAAQAAPNSCNGQQVSIIAIKDQARKDKCKEWCMNQKWISECAVFLIFCGDFYHTNIAFEKAGLPPETFQEYITNLDTLIVGCQDTGICLAYAVVAAESLGLGTVPIGAVRFNSLELTKELNLPKYVVPLVGLCVGYPEDESAVKPIDYL